jgi:hypothetical protein
VALRAKTRAAVLAAPKAHIASASPIKERIVSTRSHGQIGHSERTVKRYPVILNKRSDVKNLPVPCGLEREGRQRRTLLTVQEC